MGSLSASLVTSRRTLTGGGTAGLLTTPPSAILFHLCIAMFPPAFTTGSVESCDDFRALVVGEFKVPSTKMSGILEKKTHKKAEKATPSPGMGLGGLVSY